MKAFYLLLLLLPFCALSQKRGKDTSLVYLDQNLQLTNAKNAAFFGASVKVEGGWMLYAVYPDTTPLIKAFFKDKNLTVKEGPFTVYYPQNKKARDGFYNNNKMNGTWRFWYENGQLRDSGMVLNNYMAGTWRNWHTNGFLQAVTTFEPRPVVGDLIIQQTILETAFPPYLGSREGAYNSWYSNGQQEATGHFKANQMEGTWYWYHKNGAPATIETYNQGKVTALQCFDTAGKATGDMCSIEKPALLKQYGDFKTFVYEYLRWPEAARKKKIEGDVLVKFTITKEGKMKDLNITAAEPLLKQAVEQLFGQMQDWYPAISHNRPIESKEAITIPFRL